MVAPVVAAAGIGAAASIGSTLLGGLMSGGGGGEISYNPIAYRSALPQFGIGDSLTKQGQMATNAFEASGQDLDAARGLIPQMGMFPQLGTAEMSELANAEKVFGDNLSLAQANLNNSTAGQSNSLARTMALTGAPIGGAGSQSMFSSIAAKNQASLNEYQMQQSQQLLGLRQQLLQGVYDRLINQFNSRMTTGSQSFNMGQAFFGNTYAAARDEADRQMAVDKFNAEQKAASEASKGGGGFLGGLF